MSKPKNKDLYARVKSEAKKKFKGDWPSAYGSAWLVREYKKRGGKYAEGGLKRWFKEKWTNEKGDECGAGTTKTEAKCRPSVKVTSDTPKTWSEMSQKEKNKAIREKKEANRKGKQRAKTVLKRNNN